MRHPNHREWLLRSLLWLILGGWIGSWGLFAVVVAPTAFRVLPGVETAGSLVGPVLRSLHLYGIFAGVALAAIAVGDRRSRWLWVSPLVLAGLSAISEFAVTPAIDGVRPHELGLTSADDAAERFALLHQISRAIFGTVLLGIVGLALGNARHDVLPVASEAAQNPLDQP